MGPAGTERVRGFRAPGPDEVSTPIGSPTEAVPGSPVPPVPPVPPAGNDTETLAAGPTSRRLRDRLSTWRWLVAAGAVLAVAVVVIAVLAFRWGSTAATSGQSPAPAPPTPGASVTPLATTDLYTQVVPSVVLITTSKGSLGSGTVVTDTGTILTANHVISGGGDLTVVFADGTKSAATVSSADATTDTAVLTPRKLPEVVVPATLGGGVDVGADVVAIGNPLGLRNSTSTGVVSGLGRTSRTAAGTVTGLIQFDAAVNPGSSGGPLLNDRGDVVGVVVSIADPGKDDAFAGIGFAVPIGAALGGGGTSPGPGGGPQL